MGFGAVAISSQDGTGAEEISRLVGEALGFRLINEDIVARAAVEAGVRPDLVADVERRKSLLHKILEGFGSAGAASGGLVLPEQWAYGEFATKELRASIRSAIEDEAANGNVVIVAHAASLALAGRDDVLRVFLTASPKIRQQRLASSLDVDDKEAERILKQSDAGRADYIKRFYGIGSEQPTHYDLVLNTDKLAPDEAAGLIVAATNGGS